MPETPIQDSDSWESWRHHVLIELQDIKQGYKELSELIQAEKADRMFLAGRMKSASGIISAVVAVVVSILGFLADHLLTRPK